MWALLSIWMLLACGPAMADDAQGYFEQGLAAARHGDHEAAVEGFSQALDAGGVDPAVYHGLGNALVRQNKTGWAIAAWRRGLALEPSHPDLLANLERARRSVKDHIEARHRTMGPFFWLAWTSAATNAVGCSVLLTMALTLLWVVWTRRWKVPGWRGALAVMFGGAFVLGTAAVFSETRPIGAVVIVPEVTVESAVGDAGVPLFRLHEGAEVEVIEDAESALLVGLPDARKGWVPASVVISLDPGAPFPVR